VQLADELEVEQAMAKADWECWKKLEEGFETSHGHFLNDFNDDDQEDARRDKRVRQRWAIKLMQHAKEMDMLTPSPSPQQHGSRTKNSAQRKWSKTRRKMTGKSILCDVGSGERSIEEEAEDTCARPHSGIRLSVINEVDDDSTEEDNNNERHKTNNEITNSNKEASIGGSGFSVPSPGNDCKAGVESVIGGGFLIDSRPSSDAFNEDDNNNDSTSGIRRLNNEDKILIEEEAEDACVVSPKENSRRIDIGNDKDNNDKDNNKLLLKVQGADLKRFKKNKKRLHLTTAPLWYNCKKRTLKQACIEVGWVSIPSHLLLYTMHLWSCRGYTGSSLN
jgi:hypothetical protein